MTTYAGQPMTNGAQAKTYADNFIAVHLVKIGGGKTYDDIVDAVLVEPTKTKASQIAATRNVLGAISSVALRVVEVL